MKLREVEGKVLAAIGLRGQASLSELSRITRLRPHVCRRAVESLFERQCLHRRVVINPGRLGYSIFGLWFSLNPQAARKRQQILSYLASCPLVAYIGEFQGEFSFKVDVCGRSAADVGEVMEGLCAKFGAVISKRSFSCTVANWDFGLKFLAPLQSQPRGLRIGLEPDTVEIAEQDHVILKLLAASTNESHAGLARRLGLAATTFEYRLKKLCDQRIIVGYHVVPDLEKMHSLGVYAHVHRVRLSWHDSSVRERALQFATRDNAVYTFTHSIGDIDMEFCSAADSMRKEREFEARLDAELGDALNDRTSVSILKHHKINTYPCE